MTKLFRMLAVGGLAAVLGLVTVASVFAESPPNPPARFAGSVKVDGAAPPAGTRIEARIGSTTCGVTTTFAAGGESRYVLDAPALDPGANPNCGTDGAVVSFWIGDRKAAETGSWKNYQLNEVNLTYTTPTPTPAPSATATATPRPPTTGNVAGSSDASSTWLFAALGLGALAFGAAGMTAARRKR